MSVPPKPRAEGAPATNHLNLKPNTPSYLCPMQHLLLILKYIAAEQDTPYSGEETLFKLLHSPCFQIPALEIARLSIEVSDRQFTKNKTFLRTLLQEKINTPPKDLFTPSLHEGLRKASVLLEKWLAAANTLSPEELSEHIAQEEPIAAYMQQSADTATIPGAPEIERPETALISALLNRFTMNVSALNNYLHCPLEFYYKNIIRIPSPQNEAMGFGSAIHYALEQLFRKMLDAPGNGRQRPFPPRETFIADFEWYMHAHRESFTTAQFERRLDYGREVLSNYYASYIYSFPTVVAIERMIRVVYNGVPLKGKLDKLEFDGKSVNIVDYKTGDYDKAMTRMQPPREEEPNGGDYWRQAVFYKILVDSYEEKGWKALSTSFDFIEPDKTGQYRRGNLLITPADIATVGRQISRVWEEIQQHAFYTGCGSPTCSWCNFVKANGLAIAVHEDAGFKV